MKRIIIRSLSFSIILLVLFNIVSEILKKPKNSQWDTSGLEYTNKYPGLFDVVFSGTSITIMNVSSEELYTEYGIAAVTLGEPEQPMFLTYYTLLEALNYQSPKVVFLDINSLFYSESMLRNKINDYEHYYLHFSLDSIRNPIIKYEAFQAAKELKPDLDIFNYFSSIYYNHSNWEELGKTNFIRKSGKQVMNGYFMSFTIAEGLAKLRDSIDIDYAENVNEEELLDFNKTYLMKIVELCKEKNVQLVFLRGGGIDTALTSEKYNTINKIAIDNDIPFIDMLQHDKEMGFDWRFDASDGNHFNIMGAKKWTDYLGDYLINNYRFEDRRDDSRYKFLEEEVDRYQNALAVMQTKIDLLSAINFEQYLNALKAVDTSKNTIFISVSDDASKNLSKKDCDKLSELGLTYNLMDKFRYSYLAVLDNHTSRDLLEDCGVTLDGELDNGSRYQLSSGGYSSGVLASIRVDGLELIQGGRGINIVVYNKEYGEVLSSVYFDTFLYENPPTMRRINVDIVQEQYETSANVWSSVDDVLVQD